MEEPSLPLIAALKLMFPSASNKSVALIPPLPVFSTPLILIDVILFTYFLKFTPLGRATCLFLMDIFPVL